jgi:phosphoenolpyruvate synthase/pyruvate phosphate dikinase
MGSAVGQVPEYTEMITTWVKEVAQTPVLVKLTPNITDIRAIGRAAPVDPFQVLDRDSVGVLVKTAIDQGRAIRPDLKIGICGEHGGEPNSVEFCHLVGMNYVSCSPYRVPIARLAAAHAQINHPRN